MKHSNLYTRREFLRAGLLGGALAQTAPAFLLSTMNALSASAANSAVQGITGRDAPILVVLQLSGGNDGLNTVVPYANDFYYKARPSIAIAEKDVLKLDDHNGLNPALAGIRELYDEGFASILHGVGYPNPNRSHFRSMEIWHTAVDSDRSSSRGWLGSYFDNTCSGCDPAIAVNIGRENPQAFAATIPKGISFQAEKPLSIEDPMADAHAMMADDEEASGGSISYLRGGGGTTQIDALDFIERTQMHAQVSTEKIKTISKSYSVQESFPNSSLGRDLSTVSQLIGGGMPTRIYYVSLGGFDTHANQVGSHRNLLATLGDAMKSFMREMARQGNQKRVLVLTFSEFGRRVQENAGRGTDHGAAAPCFLFGGNLKAGVHGAIPSLDPKKLSGGDLVFNTDFRSIYASILEDHMKTDSAPILGRAFPKNNYFA